MAPTPETPACLSELAPVHAAPNARFEWLCSRLTCLNVVCSPRSKMEAAPSASKSGDEMLEAELLSASDERARRSERERVKGVCCASSIVPLASRSTEAEKSVRWLWGERERRCHFSSGEIEKARWLVRRADPLSRGASSSPTSRLKNGLTEIPFRRIEPSSCLRALLLSFAFAEPSPSRQSKEGAAGSFPMLRVSFPCIDTSSKQIPCPLR